MKKTILGLLGLSAILSMGSGIVVAQALPTLGSAMTMSVISQPYTQSQCVEPDGSIVYVVRHFYLGDTYTTSDLVPKRGNGYDTLILNTSNVKIYNASLFTFTAPITYKSNGIPNSATVDSMLLAEGTFKVSSTAPGQLIYSITRTALENAGSTSYSLSYIGRPDLANYTAQLTNKTFHNLAGWVVSGNECVNYTVHYCGDGVKDTKQSISSLAGGYASTIANEQCDGTDGVTAGYTCTSTCTLETLVVKPTCSLSLSSSSITLGKPTDVLRTINGSTTNAPQITYTPTSSVINGLPYTVPTANGSRTITPQNIGTSTLSMTVSNSAGQSTCTVPITVIANPAPTCSLSAAATTINEGESISLSASYANAVSASFSPTLGVLALTYPTRSNSNIPVAPTTTTTYTMTVNGASGTTPAVCSTTIIVKPKVVTPTCSLSAAATTINEGESTSLSASYANAVSASFSPTLGVLSLIYPTRSNSNIPVAPTTTTTYTMTVNGASGTTPAVCSTTIIVKPKTVNPTCSLTTNTATIYSGDTAILQSAYTNATATTFSPTIGGLSLIYPTRSNNYITVKPTTTTTYTMTVNGQAGTTPAVCSVTITVKPKVVTPTCTLTTSTPNIASGETAVLNAGYTNAIGAMINISGLNLIFPNRSNTNITVKPTKTTTYTLTVQGSDGSCITCSATVNVACVGLTLTKTLDNDLGYQSGDLVSFTINFANNSSVTGKNIILTDYLPDSLTYISSQIYGVPSSTFGTGTTGGMTFAQYSGFNLAPGQQGYLKIVGRYRGTGNSKLNSVFLESSNAATLYASAIFRTIYVPTANAVITKTADKTNYLLGESVHYTIKVTNNGPDSISDVKITDTRPNTGCIVAELPGSSNVSTMILTRSSNPYAWDLTPSLGVGQSVNVYLVGRISTNPSCIGSHINTVDLTYMVNGQVKTGSANVTIFISGAAPTCASMVGTTPVATANGYDVSLVCNGANTTSTTPLSINCGNGTYLPGGQGSVINGVCHYTSSFAGYAQCSVGTDTANTACKVPINISAGKCGNLNALDGEVAIYQNGTANSQYRCQTKAGTVAKSITIDCGNGTTHVGYDTSSYTATCNYTNISVPKNYTINCIVDGETPPVACQAPLLIDKGRLGYCGDGKAEGYEKCDDGNRNGTASSNCTKGCDLKGSSMVGCFNIGNTSISIQKGEMLPFRWTLEDTSNIIPGDSCDGEPDGSIPEDSITCTFKIYNGTHKESDSNPLMTFTKKCNEDTRKNYLIFKYFLDKHRRSLDHAFGKYYIGTTTFGSVFGEYKISLDKVAYKYCRSDALDEGTEIDRVCSVDFSVTQPYLAQKSSFGLTPKATNISLKGYEMIDGSDLIKSTDLSDIMVIDESEYAGGRAVTTKMANFITKYSKLAVKKGTIRSLENNVITTYKVPGQDIVVFKGAGTILYQEGATKTKPFTVILDGPSIQISGSIENTNAMFLLNKGDITFAGADLCSKPQVVRGIFVTNNGSFRAGPDLRNDNLNKRRCLYGGLKVQGVLIGNGIEDLVQSRRSQLNDRFHVGGASIASIKAERRNEIFNGAAVLIEYSPSLWNALPPGASEFTKALDIYKK